MAQELNCLLCKHEDLNPSTDIKKLDMVARAYNPSAGKAEMTPGA